MKSWNTLTKLPQAAAVTAEDAPTYYLADRLTATGFLRHVIGGRPFEITPVDQNK